MRKIIIPLLLLGFVAVVIGDWTGWGNKYTGDYTFEGNLTVEDGMTINKESATSDTALIITFDTLSGGGSVEHTGIKINGTAFSSSQYFLKGYNRDGNLKFYIRGDGKLYAGQDIVGTGFFAYNDIEVRDDCKFGSDSTDTVGIYGDLTIQGDIRKIDGTDTTTINENGIYASSSPWYYCKYMDAFSLASGGSGATLVTPDNNTLGGYNLDADNEYLYFNAAVCNNWDGASDPIVIIIWEVDVDNTGGGANDSVEIDLQCWFKGDGETSNKSQALSGRTEIGQSARYKQFMTTLTIDYDDGSNPVEEGDVFTCRLNFDATNSDISDIVINFVRFAYRCKVPNPKAY